MSNQSFSCLSLQVLDRIGHNEVSPDELLRIEEHVTECHHCREMFNSVYLSPQWSEHIRPALLETQVLVSNSETEADHPSAVLRLLGPTDEPNMLGRIGNYEIIGVVGQGGMGVVFKALDRSLNRFVAIKMLLPHLASSGAARKRFAREGQAIAAVVDDHVMAIHSVDEWQGIPYLVMTYSRGVSLQKRLNDNGPMEVREILRIGMQTAKGLSAAHVQGIVHRDIKPSNILLDQNVERVQLVDFGLARAVDDASLTCSGTLAGTPQYMSPEQARAETVDHRSDLFSLGSVLYAMCVGYAPFRAESSYSVLRLIIDKEPRPIRELNPEIPDWLCEIISKLMSKSPDDRYESADSVAIILEQCIAHVQDPLQHALPLETQKLNEPRQFKRQIATQLKRWFPIMNDKRIVSLISLILLLMALLVPWPIATVGKIESGLAFAVPASLLSLGMALLSRSEYFSKIVLWCFGLTFGLAVVGIGVSVPIYIARESSQLAIAREAAAVAAMQATVAEKELQLKADSEAKESKSKANRSQRWQRYAPDMLEAARKAGKVLIINFTADWCLYGKTLKATALNRDEVTEALNSKEVVPIEVDLTADDAAGWDLLRAYGQSDLPLLVVEGPGMQEPWQSSEYTASNVVEALTAAGKEKTTPRAALGDFLDRSLQRGEHDQGLASDSLEGVWEATHPEEQPEKKRLRIVFTKHTKAVFHGTHVLWMASYTTEPRYSPKRLRYVSDGKPMRGIYEVKVDGLRLSIADDSDAVPTRFGTEHAEFMRLKGEKARELVEIVLSAEKDGRTESLNKVP